MNIRTIIIDDELHAREGIRIRLEEFPSFNIIGECSSGLEAVETINDLKPDLLFLDIQMPEMNGFEVLRKISVMPQPQVIFVTAYDKYAIKAFECHALDYLLKPVNDNRFSETVRTVMKDFSIRNLYAYSHKLKKLIDDYYESANAETDQSEKTNEYLTRLMVKAKEEISIIRIDEIDWLESAGDYIYVHSDSKKLILRETLISLESKLDPKKFVRIHRSSIVNVDKIKNLKANEHGDFEVYLHSGTKLKLSRTYKAHFQNIIL